jgi:hypothetical protein
MASDDLRTKPEMVAREFKWARRVPQQLIRRLYTLDAKGLVEASLIDEVGYAMYARCESIRVATEAHAGRAMCFRCRGTVERRTASWRTWTKDEPLECLCGWRTTWGDYQKSYQRKQLHGGQAYPNFVEFLERWPNARSTRDKMLAIDRLIHSAHVSARFGFCRPAGVNLIEGTMHQVLDFLDELAYSDLSTPGLREKRDEWTALRRTSRWTSPEST